MANAETFILTDKDQSRFAPVTPLPAIPRHRLERNLSAKKTASTE